MARRPRRPAPAAPAILAAVLCCALAAAAESRTSVRSGSPSTPSAGEEAAGDNRATQAAEDAQAAAEGGTPPTPPAAEAATPAAPLVDCATTTCLAGPCIVSSECKPEQGCVYENVTNGTECDDGLDYTHDDVCMKGNCSGTAVTNFTEDSFQDAVEESFAKKSLLLVWFYKDDSTSVTQRTHLEHVARNLTRRDPPIKVACVHGEKSPAAAATAGVSSFPKARLFHTGVLAAGERDWDVGMYDGVKAVDKVMEWSGPSSTELSTPGDVKDRTAKSIEYPVIVGLFTMGAPEGKLDFKIFTQVAHFFRGFMHFHHVTAIQALGDLGHLGRGGAITAYRPWESKTKAFKLRFKGKIFKQSLMDWVGDNVLSPVEICTKRTQFEAYKDIISKLKRPMLRGFYSYKAIPDSEEEEKQQNEAQQDLVDRLRPAWEVAHAVKERGRRLAVAVCDGSDWVHNVASKLDFGFSDDDIKERRAFIIEDGHKEKKKSTYKWSSQDGDIAEWVTKYSKGKLEKWKKRCYVSSVTGATVAAPNVGTVNCVKSQYINHGDICEWTQDEGYNCEKMGSVVCKDGSMNSTPTCKKEKAEKEGDEKKEEGDEDEDEDDDGEGGGRDDPDP